MKTIDPAVLERHGLTRDEYDRIVRTLGRTPTDTEIGIFSVMWSEHCSYKSSRMHLKKLPTRGRRVLQGPGENAGAVDIGDGLAAVFKIESHNHPSFIEPYQGAATGVGGIIRDIFTMGARPIALMNSLRFGSLDGPAGARTRRIVEGVVAGIAGYGNSIGIATVGGEIAFEEAYAGNPLVNVLCLGIAKADALVKGRASGVGNPVYYVGAKTGRDGIHGATMASAEFDEKSAEKRPAVQVGDPFMEKLLLEACLELMATDALVGVQDMGAAGLTCSTCEMGARGGSGVEIDIMHVPQRETGMTPYEIMLSESQERMLLAVKKGREAEVERIFDKWDLHAVRIGVVTDDKLMRVKDHGEVVAEIPNTALVDEAPLYDRPATRPGYLDEVQKLDVSALPDSPPQQSLLQLLASPTIASKRWVYRQYDHMVRLGTIVLAGMGAGVVRIKGTPRALALSVDGNGRYCYLDPRRGAMLAVAEAARNVACAGATPIGATNCLNFGNPERPEIMWQIVEAIEGIAEACRALDVPITGGNVSLYNETDGTAIYPTPVLGVVGLIEDAARALSRTFKHEGDEIVLLGEGFGELGGSEYLKVVHGQVKGQPPMLDLKREAALVALLVRATAAGLLESAHDCSDGGAAVALAECSFGSGGIGLDADVPPPSSVPAELKFGPTAVGADAVVGPNFSSAPAVGADGVVGPDFSSAPAVGADGVVGPDFSSAPAVGADGVVGPDFSSAPAVGADGVVGPDLSSAPAVGADGVVGPNFSSAPAVGADGVVGPNFSSAPAVAAALFGESASRAIVSVAPANRAALLAMAAQAGVPAAAIGRTGGSRLRLSVGGRAAIDCGLDDAEQVWATALERYFAGRAA